MDTLKEILVPVYNTISILGKKENSSVINTLGKLLESGLLVPKYKYNDKVWFLHNNKVDIGIIEGYEIIQTSDIQIITYCFQHQQFNKLEDELFTSGHDLVETLK